MADSGEPMMFPIDGVYQPNPVDYSAPDISSSSKERISNKFIFIKAAAKTVSSEIMFCLPKEGGTISDLLVVKVTKPKRERPRNEGPVLEQIQKKMPEHYCHHFPKVKEYKEEEGWLAMTAYNRSITLEDFVNHCTIKRAVPLGFLVVLLYKLTKIYQTMENEKIGHGDIHAGNILLQISPDDTKAFPSIRIVDFNRESAISNCSGFVSFMDMMMDPLFRMTVLNRNWNEFRAKPSLWRKKGVEYNELDTALKELKETIGASEETLSPGAQTLFQEITDLKLRNNLWVTEEDINNAVKKAGDKVH